MVQSAAVPMTFAQVAAAYLAAPAVVIGTPCPVVFESQQNPQRDPICVVVPSAFGHVVRVLQALMSSASSAAARFHIHVPPVGNEPRNSGPCGVPIAPTDVAVG